MENEKSRSDNNDTFTGFNDESVQEIPKKSEGKQQRAENLKQIERISAEHDTEELDELHRELGKDFHETPEQELKNYYDTHLEDFKKNNMSYDDYAKRIRQWEKDNLKRQNPDK